MTAGRDHRNARIRRWNLRAATFVSTPDRLRIAVHWGPHRRISGVSGTVRADAASPSDDASHGAGGGP